MRALAATSGERPHSKLTASHTTRWALVYIRQSTPQQIVQNQESTRIQYSLRERALALGWERDRIAVIDEDLGRSGAQVEGRPGFQRLVAEVSLDRVGIILGAEVSRFARSCRDWYQLLDLCALFGTLIGDLDGLYDPANHNDRLLLGLKGTMSEAELHLLKRRMLDGRKAKACRGELHQQLPMGYVRNPSGEVCKDPDEQARLVIETVFHQFTVVGSARGVLQFLVRNGLRLPVRERSIPHKGELSWRRPCMASVCNILKNPAYSGAYVVGRRPIDHRRIKPGRPGTGRPDLPLEDWGVVLKDRLPAYVTWEEYLNNREQLRANTPKEMGSVREGPLLLTGLVVCGRCGRRMRSYASKEKAEVRYVCSMECSTYGGPCCQSFAGRCLDQEVERQVLELLQPAALEVSLAVASDLEAQRAREETLWRQRLERARYEAERAQRQYDAVEPENRLVVRTLERQWEAALQALNDMEEAFHRHQTEIPPSLTPAERESLRALASDIRGLWYASTTTPRDRKEIIRQLVDRVTATILGESEQIQVTIHWAGGCETQAMVARPLRKLEQLSYLGPMIERVQALVREGKTSKEIAAILNQEGWRKARRVGPIKADWVRALRSGPAERYLGHKIRFRQEDLGPNEWTIRDLARELEMPAATLTGWLRAGQLTIRKDQQQPQHWIIQADPQEIDRLRSIRNRWQAKTNTRDTPREGKEDTNGL